MRRFVVFPRLDRSTVGLVLLLAACQPAGAPAQKQRGETHANPPVPAGASASTPSGGNIDQPAPQQNGLGPVRAGMSKAEITALGLPVRETTEELEAVPYVVLVLSPAADVELKATMKDDRVIEVSTVSKRFTTPAGAHVGDTLGRLQELYPAGEVYRGFEEGTYFSFDPGVGGMVFFFDLNKISNACIRDDKNCPADPKTFKSISLTAR